jgi:hypothetical protein
MHFIEHKELSGVLHPKRQLAINFKQLTIRRTCGFLDEDFGYSQSFFE